MRNNAKLKAHIKFKIREFIRILPFHILVMGSVFIIASIFNKYLEALLFLISFFSLRYKFDKTYHSDSLVTCMICTISLFSLSIVVILPIYTSVFSSILFAFIDCYILWFIRDRKDAKIESVLLESKIEDCLRELKEYKNVDLYQMSEGELRSYGASRRLSETQQDILCMRVIEHLKISEICQYRNFGRTTIKYHISQIKEKLKVDYI